EPLPFWLQEYVVCGGEDRPAKPGTDPATNVVRDALIAEAVDAVTQRQYVLRYASSTHERDFFITLRPTRNKATTHIESGCSIVKKVLAEKEFDWHMTEDNVKAIWLKNRDRLPKKERAPLHSDPQDRIKQWWASDLLAS